MSNKTKHFVFLAFAMLLTTSMQAQDAAAGNAGLSVAVTSITEYFPTVKLLCYAIGGVVGLIGGIRIFNKWNNGDNDINKELVGYGGAMLFLVIMPNVIQAFFGL